MNSRISDDVKELFICFCEVARPEPPGSPGLIILKYPENYNEKEILDTIPKFVFPCDFDNSIVQHFSFVLTNINSKWTFGYCRHDPKTSTALVFLSYLPWHEVFVEILNTTAGLIRTCEAHDLTQFLQNLLAYHLPEPGSKIVIRLNDKLGSFNCTTPAQFGLPSIQVNRNIIEYYSAVDANSMIGIFASMLHERRIIFKSHRLPRLSACVQAANTLLYPMSWQHIFIPLMPAQLTDYLLAPMPYLIGIPTSTWESVRHTSEIGDVVILDLDASRNQTGFDSNFNDTERLPQDVIRFLKTQLKDQAAMREDGLARTFLRALVRLIGGYRDALKFQQGEKITFNEDAFVESRTVSMQPFLREMLQLQIFRQFIEERLDILNAGLGFSDEFELEANNYTAKSHSAINEQYNHWVTHMKKHSSAILKSVKNKTNPAMKSAVRKVKESGKDVKSAYKDIKTRIRKDGHTNHGETSSSTFHYRSRPLTIGSPITSNATYSKSRAMSAVVSNSRSNEYVPLSSPLEDVTSPAPGDAIRSEMNLLADIEQAINQKCSIMDSSPPVDRTLKPVRSLDASISPTSHDVTPAPRGGHLPLSRTSCSLPLDSPSPTNPFLFPGFQTDPFGFTPFGTTVEKPNVDRTNFFDSPIDQIQSNSVPKINLIDDIKIPHESTPSIHPMLQWINSFPDSQPHSFDSTISQHSSSFQTQQSSSLDHFIPSIFPPLQANSNLSFSNIPILVPPPLPQRKLAPASKPSQCNGTRDLIRLDSESSHDNSLSRESSDDSIKFKTGITNPLYPYTTPLSLNAADTTPSILQPPPHIRNNSSFVHSKPKSSYFNEKDMDLLKEYGIDFNGAATGDNNNENARKAAADPFDMPFESATRSTPSTWATFD